MDKGNRHNLVTFGLAGLLLLPACRWDAPDPERDDTPTSGRILVLADADCRAVIDQELMVFTSFYPKAEVNVRYMDEAALLRNMQSDSVRCVVTTVDPGADQDAYLRSRNITPRIVPVYHGGVAVAINPASPVRQLDLDDLRRLLDRQALNVTTDVADTRALDSLEAIFAGSGSGVARLLVDSLGIKQLKARSVPDVAAAMDQVANNPRTVALLPFEAISDLDNPQVREWRNRVRLVPIAATPGGEALLPSQSTLADGSYPLRRTVKMIVMEGKSGLGTGFVSFVANHKGQRIILKLGVAPISIPSRDVEIVP